MNQPLAYEDAIALLDADHKAVKKMFIDFAAICDDGASAGEKSLLAKRICQALTIHTQIEEEIFYPAVRKATGDDALMDEAIEEHAEAKQMIATIMKMKPDSAEFDNTVKELSKSIDAHVLEEREQIFLHARIAPLDLRGMVVPLFARKQQLTQKTSTRVKETA